MTTRRVLVGGGALVLLLATVLVFLAFDRHSHSGSDTLRPFVLTMLPVWLLATLGGRRLLHRHGGRS